jgi:hypothetical protein
MLIVPKANGVGMILFSENSVADAESVMGTPKRMQSSVGNV